LLVASARGVLIACVHMRGADEEGGAGIFDQCTISDDEGSDDAGAAPTCDTAAGASSHTPPVSLDAPAFTRWSLQGPEEGTDDDPAASRARAAALATLRRRSSASGDGGLAGGVGTGGDGGGERAEDDVLLMRPLLADERSRLVDGLIVLSDSASLGAAGSQGSGQASQGRPLPLGGREAGTGAAGSEGDDEGKMMPLVWRSLIPLMGGFAEGAREHAACDSPCVRDPDREKT